MATVQANIQYPTRMGVIWSGTKVLASPAFTAVKYGMKHDCIVVLSNHITSITVIRISGSITVY